jgi:hypothetical protein
MGHITKACAVCHEVVLEATGDWACIDLGPCGDPGSDVYEFFRCSYCKEHNLEPEDDRLTPEDLGDIAYHQAVDEDRTF